MAPLCSCHALMAGIWTSKLTKIVNEIWLTETFWGIESFKILKDVGNEQWWLNTMSQVSISTVYSPLPSTLSLFYNPAAFETFSFSNATFGFILLFHLMMFFLHFFYNTVFIHFCFKSSPGLNLVKQVSNPSSLQHWAYIFIGLEFDHCLPCPAPAPHIFALALPPPSPSW